MIDRLVSIGFSRREYRQQPKAFYSLVIDDQTIERH